MCHLDPNLRAELVAFELLAEGLSVAIAVTGASMSPFLHSFDVIEVVPRKGRPSIGEVVVFPRPGGGMVVHRVVAIDSSGLLLTRGDGASEADGWIDPQVVAGCVVGALRQGRRVRWGLGPKAKWIGHLSRRGLLLPLLRPLRWWMRQRTTVESGGED